MQAGRCLARRLVPARHFLCLQKGLSIVSFLAIGAFILYTGAEPFIDAILQVGRTLHASPEVLTVLTAVEVAERFAPPNRTVGLKEVEAASRALEHLARKGVLCCHRVRGEVRYSND